MESAPRAVDVKDQDRWRCRVRDFVTAGLVDHLHLVQVPIVLGRGARVCDVLESLSRATTSRWSSQRRHSPGLDAQGALLAVVVAFSHPKG